MTSHSPARRRVRSGTSAVAASYLAFSTAFLTAALSAQTPAIPPPAPYPPSPVIAGIDWHWPTYTHAGEGSDLWPVTWAADNLLYTAWGDGGL